MIASVIKWVCLAHHMWLPLWKYALLLLILPWGREIPHAGGASEAQLIHEDPAL